MLSGASTAVETQQSTLSRYLDGEFWQFKDDIREDIRRCELFHQTSFDLTLDQTRDLTMERVYYVMQTPLMRQHFRDQVTEKQRGFIAKSLGLTEVICSADMTTGVKLGVICGLYGGAVINLGNPEQKDKWYLPVSDLEFTGMFAMTERGHGSNVRGILTEAQYDPSTEEFIINTPCVDAQKMYIGNCMKGNHASVFAQLTVNGETQGPHCFIVPIRDRHGVMHPGVTAIDMRHKEGLHGVDNGILIFDNVRIPRENLLSRFGSVSADGVYSSPIQNKSHRFNAMLAALTPTRLALTVQAMAGMKLGLIIAVRYSHSRRQFGPKDKDEVKIIEHQTQYLRLMPHLAAALALTFTTRFAAAMMDDVLCGGESLDNNRSLQALMAGLKAYSTWQNIHCLQECRECTGGMGFMMENRIPGLKCDSDVFVTFEGDNMVMLQVKKNNCLFFDAWNSCLHHITSLALAHIHRVTLEQFALAVEQCPVEEDRTLLTKFCLLHGTNLVYQERGWYLEHHYLTPRTSRLIRNQLLELCRLVKDEALKVVSDFKVPPFCIKAPIAGVANPRAQWAFYSTPDPAPSASSLPQHHGRTSKL
ncbi:acyl-coenzyme A oxidase-like protein isoform X3 [Lampris incognitus]|uniref:acyl-coenzyme A oxidase-like protein isoform X3 n=1 Tax=Lampris incognitus TaxID=2546036 RepID=UPI0024B493BA|nr:acyl-coenzyme A oxidase-like protein isoform X3 [Lampris incognitus]